MNKGKASIPNDNNNNNNSNMDTIRHVNNDRAVSGGRPRFKIALLGEAGVGKTSLFLRVRDNEFTNGPTASIGVDSCSFNVKVDDTEIKVCLWDTAGVERFRTLTRNFYRNADAVLLSFSVNNPSTLYYLTKWEDDARRYAPHALRFLVGCKNDLETLVTKECIENFASSHDCEYAFRTSSKSGEGISEAMTAITTRLVAVHSRGREQLEHSWLEENVNVNQGQLVESRNSCC